MSSFASYRAPYGSATQWALLVACALIVPGGWNSVVADDETKPAAGDALDQALTTPAETPATPAGDDETSEDEKQRPFMDPPENAKPLSKDGRAWIDREKNLVIVDGRIVLRKGQLEMFACTPRTKEHESIVAVECKAFVIHAGLLAVGAETGRPVIFSPEFKPPTGTQVDIYVEWKDEKDKLHRVKAQELMRDARTKKTMDLPWVFAGSGFVHNEKMGTSRYLAEDGDLVCVANFSSAMLDVPAEMSADNASLLYETYTERIPPLGWPVRLIFDPVLPDEEKAADNAEKKTDEAEKPAATSEEKKEEE